MEKEIVAVGIGASAGGLEALQGLLRNLPDNTNMAYIVAQHLSPTYKSMMVDLLAKETQLPVLEAKNGEKLNVDTIYVCPPNKDITVTNDTIVLSAPDTRLYGPKPSVDIFFESLAMNKGIHAIGIILSGTGSDGARGVRAIKAEGGYVMAQVPETAKYDGMPVSAINTGNIDLILPPEDMGSELIELLSYPAKAIMAEEDSLFTNLYTNILSKLFDVKGVDFSVYKPSTIQRRIERRMAALKLINLTDYHNYLAQHADEVEALFKDILIGVTSFFRDREAFDAMEARMRELIGLKEKEDTTLRIWAPGSSTGEEAYSIAIMLSMILKEEVARYKIQIFATDIDEAALAFARKGRYPESALMEVDKTIKNRFFLAKSDHYEVIKPIREMVIFSRHDIIKDPPFLRLDAIVCRNLLIYFSQELQKKLFPTFHYAINQNGLLFLGKSESVGHFSNYFKTADKKWKIYKTNFLGNKQPPSTFNLREARQLERQRHTLQTPAKPTLQERMYDYINETIVPMCIIVNDNKDIVFVKGKNPYLVQPEGERTDNVFKNVLSTLNVELRAIMHECEKEGEVVKSAFQKVALYDDAVRFVRMVVMPMDGADESQLYMICFQEESSEQFKTFEVGKLKDDSEQSKQLELELARTKEHLQTVIEELETSNEEMQSLNEELQSSNEELQSSNEELETTNEELQSTNEELQTAYTELRALYDDKADHNKTLEEYKEQLERNNVRLGAALNASDVGIFEKSVPPAADDYWSEEWCSALGYNPGDLPTDKTTMPEWIHAHIHPDDLESYKAHFMRFVNGSDEKLTHRFRFQDKSGKWRWIESALMAVHRNVEQGVTRIVGAYRNITEESERITRLEKSESLLQDAQAIAGLGLWEWDVEADRLSWTEKMYEIFGIASDTPLSYERFVAQIVTDDVGKVKSAVEASLANQAAYHVAYTLKNGRRVEAKGQVIIDENGRSQKMVGVVQDVTQAGEGQADLVINQSRIDTLVSNRLNGVYLFDFAANTNIFINDQYTKITGYTLDELHAMNDETFLTLFHPDELDTVLAHMNAVKGLKLGESSRIKYRFKRKDGQWITCHSTDVILDVDENGSPLRMLGSFIEIG
jgi:two-component system CheB/CheR fusion protein